eukprot:333246-Pelagomonas_calceolata.AAC.11
MTKAVIRLLQLPHGVQVGENGMQEKSSSFDGMQSDPCREAAIKHSPGPRTAASQTSSRAKHRPA